MTAEVSKYTIEQIESLELAPGTEHEKLEGWVPELAGEDAVRDALEKAFDYRGDVTITTRSGERIEAFIFNRRTGATLADSYTSVVTAITDPVRGERLVVLFTDPDMTPHTLWERLCQTELPRLWLPKREDLHHVEAIPMLGTGKIDLRMVRQLAMELSFAKATA